MRPNPEFVAHVKSVASSGDTILVMCRSGGRGAKAVNRLAEAGFTDVYSVVDGMEGDTLDDPISEFHGKRRVNSWKNAGLPWTYEIDPELMRVPEE